MAYLLLRMRVSNWINCAIDVGTHLNQPFWLFNSTLNQKKQQKYLISSRCDLTFTNFIWIANKTHIDIEMIVIKDTCILTQFRTISLTASNKMSSTGVQFKKLLPFHNFFSLYRCHFKLIWGVRTVWCNLNTCSVFWQGKSRTFIYNF